MIIFRIWICYFSP